ncbi:hypothetical protein GUJ93_ZPchr0012g21539 [Zizania palustris]|uniref:Uncharacterized protein n=1 Tax=Zizania palustris TaxID=103762 RepID=A0A8J6BXA5_ZIZPA|nr:hypothetical protein GUJ93_ZPchr0012g21539 [Zizania palustris]
MQNLLDRFTRVTLDRRPQAWPSAVKMDNRRTTATASASAGTIAGGGKGNGPRIPLSLVGRGRGRGARSPQVRRTEP